MTETRTTTPTAPSAIIGIRRIAVVVIIVSLALTAALGVIALLSGDFGDVQTRILLTTLLVAGFSITALCHLAVASRPIRAIGFVGIAISVVALALGLFLIWGAFEWYDAAGGILRWFAVTSIAAASLAQANLLLLLAGRRHTLVKVGLAVTVASIAIIFAMLTFPILTDDVIGDGETYWRILGVVAIVDALGTIVVPVVAIFLRDDRATHSTQRPSDQASTEVTVRLPALLVERLMNAAAARGATLDAVVDEAVTRHLNSSDSAHSGPGHDAPRS